MSKTGSTRGLFPRFITALKRAWARGLPNISPVDRTYSALMPKASTFLVQIDELSEGVAPYLFLRFQPSPKAWRVGEFTINVIASRQRGAPRRDVRKPSAFFRGEEGYFRIGGLVHGHDKWWALAPARDELPGSMPTFVRVVSSTGETTTRRTETPRAIVTWRPSTYANEEAVFAETIADVTADVHALLAHAASRLR